MTETDLIEKLRSLKATGATGFEGLVAQALERLMDQHFCLARSGDQGGGDMLSPQSGNIVVAECKLYGAKKLDERALLGELAQAILAHASLDLWILATTASVSAQLRTQLDRAARRDSVGLLVLDADTSRPKASPLLCLILEYADMAAPFLRANIPGFDEPSFRTWAASHVADSSHRKTIRYLQAELDRQLLLVRSQEINDSLMHRFASDCHPNFINQDIRPQFAVSRKKVADALSAWFKGRSATAVAAVVGEEGMGKTWAVAKWLHDESQALPCPSLLLTSAQVGKTAEPEDLLAYALQQACANTAYHEPSRLRRLIQRWKQAGRRRILVVLDGLNEWHPPDSARDLIIKWLDSGLHVIAPLVVTCRHAYWEQVLKPHMASAVEIPVEGYTDHELAEVLEKYSLGISDLPRSIHHIVRRPRYLALAVALRAELRDFANVTPAVLVYKDFEHRRWQNPKAMSHLGISDAEDFSDLLSKLARASLMPQKAGLPLAVPREALRDTIRSFGVADWQCTRNEMCSMAILHRAGSGEYALNETYLRHYLGLLIYEESRQMETQDESDYLNAFGKLLEPYQGFDFKEECLAAAVAIAFLKEDAVPRTQRRLLQSWLTVQGFQAWEELAALLPRALPALLDVTEDVAARDVNVSWGLERGLPYVLGMAVAASSDDPHSTVLQRLNRWLTFAKRTVEHAVLEDTLTVNGSTGSIGEFSYCLVEGIGMFALARIATSLLVCYPRMACLDGLIAQVVLQYSGRECVSDDLLRWVVSQAYGERAVGEVLRQLQAATTTPTAVSPERVKALLNMAAWMGESSLGPYICAIPDNFVDSEGRLHNMAAAKLRAARECWCPQTAQMCRKTEASGPFPPDNLPWQSPAHNARYTLMWQRDQPTIDRLVARLKKGNGPIFSIDLPPIYESPHGGWLCEWVASDVFPRCYVDNVWCGPFPIDSLRPAPYAATCLCQLLMGLNWQQAQRFLPMMDLSVWGNGELGDLTSLLEWDQWEVALSQLRAKPLRQGQWKGEAERQWEQLAPILYRCRPELAAKVHVAQVAWMRSAESPELMAVLLQRGPAAALGEAESAALQEVLVHYLANSAADHKEAWGVEILKAALVALPTAESARALLFRADPSLSRYMCFDSVWYALGEPSLVRALAAELRDCTDETRHASLLWGIRCVGGHDPDSARQAARDALQSPNPGIRSAATAVLSDWGEACDARTVWGHLDDYDLLNSNRRAFAAVLLVKHARALDHRPVGELLGALPPWVVGEVVTAWEDGAAVADYASAIEARLRQSAGHDVCLSDPDLERRVAQAAVPPKKDMRHMPEGIATLRTLTYLSKHQRAWFEHWTDWALDGGLCGERFRCHFPNLAWSIAFVHLSERSDKGVELVRRLRECSSVRFVSSCGLEQWHVEICASSFPSAEQYRGECIVMGRAKPAT